MSQSLARRGVSSIKWNITASIFSFLLHFTQIAILSQLLPVEVFGTYAAAAAVISISSLFASFGLASAFFHRAPETEDINQAAALHLTLKLVLTGLWTLVMTLGVLLLVPPTQQDLRTAFLVIILAETIIHLTQTPRAYLGRQVLHRRLAILQITHIVLATIFSIALALGGFTLWALLVSNLVEAVVCVAGLYLWRPVWRPRLAWSVPGFRYYLGFGSRQFIANLLMYLLDKFDDIWTGSYLGTQPLGFYSRAYQFARLPSYAIASPINNVATGIYSELTGQPQTLSRMFARINALMVRSGFYLAGLAALIAPEFILLFLGARWLPMLDAFRLMLVFALFEPMKQTIGSLFTAVGRPGLLVRVRSVQLIVMLIGLFALGPSLGIAGVALAVDVMLVVGIALLLWQARRHVQYSLAGLFAVPAIAVTLALIAGVATSQADPAQAAWLAALLKGLVFTAVYALILLLWDRQQINDALAMLRKYALPRSASE